MSEQTKLIKQSYDQMVEAYANERHQLRSDKYLRDFEQLLPKQGSVLDLGCGNGVPVAEYLIKRGFLVTGIDISSEQIKRAKQNCPRGEFILGDLEELQMGEYFVDGVVSFYTIFHLPRTNHLRILKTINSFLPIGGALLITMGDRDFEGFHSLYGEKMWSSHYGPAKNVELVQKAGFEIILDEIDTSGRERHQIILAKKIS